MDKIKSKRFFSTTSTGSAGDDAGLLSLSPDEVIDGLGPDAFGEKEPQEGAKDLHEKFTDYTEKKSELFPEEEAKEAWYLSAEDKLKQVEQDMGKPDSKATHNQKIDFSIGVTTIHSLFAGEEIPSYTPTYQAPDEAAVQREVEQKIAKVKATFVTKPATS